MKKHMIYSVSLSLMLLVACTADKTPTQPTSDSTEKEAAVTPVASNEMTLEIEGMSCVMGCGGSIRKVLKKGNGLASCSFPEFDAEQEWNKAVIQFDGDKLSADEIIARIEAANDGQFTVRNVQTKRLEPQDAPATESAGTGNKQQGLEMTSRAWTLPNLLDVFRSMLSE